MGATRNGSARARPDEDLVRAALGGETEAFGELVERYSGMVQAVAFERTFDHDAADEVTQQAMLAAFSELSRLREPAKFASWLYSISKRAAIAWVRERSAEPRQEGVSSLEDRSAEPAAVGDGSRERVRAELEALGDDHREIIILRYYRGAKVREIAEFLEITVSNAKVRLMRAREALRRRLGDLCGDE